MTHYEPVYPSFMLKIAAVGAWLYPILALFSRWSFFGNRSRMLLWRDNSEYANVLFELLAATALLLFAGGLQIYLRKLEDEFSDKRKSQRFSSNMAPIFALLLATVFLVASVSEGKPRMVLDTLAGIVVAVFVLVTLVELGRGQFGVLLGWLGIGCVILNLFRAATVFFEDGKSLTQRAIYQPGMLLCQIAAIAFCFWLIMVGVVLFKQSRRRTG